MLRLADKNSFSVKFDKFIIILKLLKNSIINKIYAKLKSVTLIPKNNLSK